MNYYFFTLRLGNSNPISSWQGKRETRVFYQRGVYFALAFETSSKQHTLKLKPSSSAVLDATAPAGLRNVQVAGCFLSVVLLHPWICTSIYPYLYTDVI